MLFLKLLALTCLSVFGASADKIQSDDAIEFESADIGERRRIDSKCSVSYFCGGMQFFLHCCRTSYDYRVGRRSMLEELLTRSVSEIARMLDIGREVWLY